MSRLKTKITRPSESPLPERQFDAAIRKTPVVLWHAEEGPTPSGNSKWPELEIAALKECLAAWSQVSDIRFMAANDAKAADLLCYSVPHIDSSPYTLVKLDSAPDDIRRTALFIKRGYVSIAVRRIRADFERLLQVSHRT